MLVLPYRTLPALPPDPYERAWRDLARRRATAHALGIVCAIAGVALLVGHTVWPLLVATNLLIGARLHVSGFVCPKCQSRFFRSGTKAMRRRCDKCGIEEGTSRRLHDAL